jgi:signal transduction histidine kinase
LEKAKIELSNKKSREKLYYIIIFLMVAIGVIHFSRYRAKQALYKKLQQKNKEIEQEINYKNKALDALALSEKELKISNAAKDKFFSIIAHDLKSPFSAILGFSELLSEQPENFDEEHRNQMIHHINDTAKRTYHLLENLLVWASAQTNRLIYQPQIINLKTIIDENVALQQPGAKKKNISMKNTLKGDLFVFADKDMLSTIFRNFLSNAIKFTSEQGIISIGAREIQEERKMQVWIEDSGVGISAEDLPTLFDLSKVKTNPGTRNEKGTGLGLAICKEFIELHNGTITVESQPGKGSIFRFTLPLTETK